MSASWGVRQKQWEVVGNPLARPKGFPPMPFEIPPPPPPDAKSTPGVASAEDLRAKLQESLPCVAFWGWEVRRHELEIVSGEVLGVQARLSQHGEHRASLEASRLPGNGQLWWYVTSDAASICAGFSTMEIALRVLYERLGIRKPEEFDPLLVKAGEMASAAGRMTSPSATLGEICEQLPFLRKAVRSYDDEILARAAAKHKAHSAEEKEV